jgi:hypothetical protein
MLKNDKIYHLDKIFDDSFNANYFNWMNSSHFFVNEKYLIMN